MRDVARGLGLTPAQEEKLARVQAGLGLMADLSRADVLCYVPWKRGKVRVLAHARPHSIPPVHGTSLRGRTFTPEEQPLVSRALEHRTLWRSARSILSKGSPVEQQVFQVWDDETGKPIAVLCVETNLIEHERHRRRSPVFQRALRLFQMGVAQGAYPSLAELSPFGEHDGVIVVDLDGHIRYMSGIATNLYRKLGYMGDMIGRTISELETSDAGLVAEALGERLPLEREVTERGRVHVKKVIPFYDWVGPWGRLQRWVAPHKVEPRLAGALLLIHDCTEARLKERQLRVKSAMIQEVHHRVKNSLQNIASLLRMQARRSGSSEVRTALEEAVSRILTVAVVHEFLAYQESGTVDMREVAQRIIRQAREVVLSPERPIHLRLEGEAVQLPTQQATTCSLVINELLQNALDHAFDGDRPGTICVRLEDLGDRVSVTVEDNGRGLPEDFQVGRGGSLGLQIVETLVTEDLKGTFSIHRRPGGGAVAVATFPKTQAGGEEPWNARE
ncbi:MAG: histidine kinase N-terminal domain-containing protein [Anaerolineae bacterium]|nr:histidine kinase N-terminal domain-containing protein [Anaerolineae bacterium]